MSPGRNVYDLHLALLDCSKLPRSSVAVGFAPIGRNTLRAVGFLASPAVLPSRSWYPVCACLQVPRPDVFLDVALLGQQCHTSSTEMA